SSDPVAQPRMLHVAPGRRTRAQVVAGGEGDRVALVCRDHVVLFRGMIGDVGTEVGQQGVRHASEHPHTLVTQLLEGPVGLEHYLVPGISSRMSLIDSSFESTSLERPCSRIERAASIIAG